MRLPFSSPPPSFLGFGRAAPGDDKLDRILGAVEQLGARLTALETRSPATPTSPASSKGGSDHPPTPYPSSSSVAQAVADIAGLAQVQEEDSEEAEQHERPSFMDQLKANLQGVQDHRRATSSRPTRLGRPKEASSELETKSVDLDGPMAHYLLDTVRANRYRSVTEYVMRREWDNKRSAHEARRAAQALDFGIEDGLPSDSRVIECLARTILGLCYADDERMPTLMDTFEYAPPRALIPTALLDKAIKVTKRRQTATSGSGGGKK